MKEIAQWKQRHREMKASTMKVRPVYWWYLSHLMLGEHQVVFEGCDGADLALRQLGLSKQ
jgi:hypothetical protein